MDLSKTYKSLMTLIKNTSGAIMIIAKELKEAASEGDRVKVFKLKNQLASFSNTINDLEMAAALTENQMEKCNDAR